MSRSKAIGTSAETAVACWLQVNGWPECERQPLRGSRDQTAAALGKPAWWIERHLKECTREKRTA